MNIAVRKILVLLPVVVLGLVYGYDHAVWYMHASGKRLLFLALTFALLYGWMLAEVLVRRQDGAVRMAVQSSFYVYIFMVLTLTGYFILFREVSSHGWWDRMMQRIDSKDRVNLTFFKIFKIYKMSNTQIVGNFIMLLPLGIYLPLLYRRLSHFLYVLLVSLLVSVLIESLQLATSYRSADVDDVLLNTLGACAGYAIYAAAVSFKKIRYAVTPAS